MKSRNLIGDPEEVNRRSLQRRGPVRVKVACKNPKEINETSNVYFNGLGFQITWTVEMENIVESQPPKPESTKPPVRIGWIFKILSIFPIPWAIVQKICRYISCILEARQPCSSQHLPSAETAPSVPDGI